MKACRRFFGHRRADLNCINKSVGGGSQFRWRAYFNSIISSEALEAMLPEIQQWEAWSREVTLSIEGFTLHRDGVELRAKLANKTSIPIKGAVFLVAYHDKDDDKLILTQGPLLAEPEKPLMPGESTPITLFVERPIFGTGLKPDVLKTNAAGTFSMRLTRLITTIPQSYTQPRFMGHSLRAT